MFINVSLVGNKEIRALNKKYLGRDCDTDVLSFNYGEGSDLLVAGGIKRKVGEPFRGDFLGDVVVSVEKAREQANLYGNTYEQEVADLVAHGVLHLLGVHHKGDNHETSRRPGESRGKIQK